MLQLRRLRNCLDSTSVRHFHKKKLPGYPQDFEDIPGEVMFPDNFSNFGETGQAYEYKSKSPKETVMFCCGYAVHGALGHYFQKKDKMKGRSDPRFKHFFKPFRHTLGEYHDVKDITAGYGFSAFSVRSKKDSRVWGTGLNTDSQIGYHDSRKDNPLGVLLSPAPINLNLKTPSKTTVLSLSAGRAHLVVVTDEGVCTLGNNSYGQCGRNIIENEKYMGSRIVHKIPTVGGEKVKSVECGQDHTLFLTESGAVYSCGWGADGQTGLGHYNNQSHPERVLGDIEGENIVKMSSKSDCVLAINDKGDVFGWGNSEYSQLFGQFDSFQQINRPIHLKKCQGFGKIVDVAAAGSFCMMLNEAGEVFSWGYGILGRGPNVSQSWIPEMIPPILFGKNDFQPNCKVTSIYCGLHCSGAINNFGHIYTWGKNRNGCLGLGHTDDQFFPLKVYLGASGKKLAIGVDHMFVLCRPF